MATRTLIIVPTYNEKENVPILLEKIFMELPLAHVLVVDDGSPDGTGELVLRLEKLHPGQVFLLERAGKQGLGAAYRAGFAWAMQRDYDLFIQMDADGSHPTTALPRMVRELSGRSDMVVGSRYVKGGRTLNWPWHRKLISRVGNLYVGIVLGLSLGDATAGFKGFTRDAVEVVDLLNSEANGYSFQIENSWRARRRGLRIREVPIVFTERVFGTSKMSGSIVQEALLKVLVWRWEELRTRFTKNKKAR